jgi:hypothetical protein
LLWCCIIDHSSSKPRSRRHRRLAGTAPLLCLLDPLRNFLRRHPRRRIIAELVHQRGNGCEPTCLLLVIHEPLHELRIRRLALRRRSQHG